MNNRIDFPLSDTVWNEARIDASTHALMVMQYSHHEIHAGKMYELFATDADLDTGEVLSISFTTPATEEIHVICKASSTSSGTFSVMESTVITANSGSALTAFNRNRNSSNTTGIRSFATVPVAGATLAATITGAGTAVHTETIGVGRSLGFSSSRDDQEIILKKATNYTFKIVGLANDGLADINIMFYEHTPKS